MTTSPIAESTQALIQRQTWLPPLAEELHGLVERAYEALPDDGEAVSDLLHGTWLGHPLHPALTDIPIGAWSVAAALDLMEAFGVKRFAAGADAAVGFGVAGSIAALATGWNDWHRIGGGPRSRRALTTGLVHGLLNEAGVFLQVGSLLARRRGRRGLGRLLSFTGLGVTLASAYLGGQLVFEDAVGVRE